MSVRKGPSFHGWNADSTLPRCCPSPWPASGTLDEVLGSSRSLPPSPLPLPRHFMQSIAHLFLPASNGATAPPSRLVQPVLATPDRLCLSAASPQLSDGALAGEGDVAQSGKGAAAVFSADRPLIHATGRSQDFDTTLWLRIECAYQGVCSSTLHGYSLKFSATNDAAVFCAGLRAAEAELLTGHRSAGDTADGAGLAAWGQSSHTAQTAIDAHIT